MKCQGLLFYDQIIQHCHYYDPWRTRIPIWYNDPLFIHFSTNWYVVLVTWMALMVSLMVLMVPKLVWKVSNSLGWEGGIMEWVVPNGTQCDVPGGLSWY